MVIPTYFATAAIDIAENGWISSYNDWIFNLWPPGFVLLEASIIKVAGAWSTRNSDTANIGGRIIFIRASAAL